MEGVPGLPDWMFGYNLLNGLYFEGYYGSPTGISGSFTVKDSLFRHVSSGTPSAGPTDAYIQITRNTYEGRLLRHGSGKFL